MPFDSLDNPLLYEINALAWIYDLRQKMGGEISLSTIPDGVWQQYRDAGFNLLWLMGAWQRSPRARQIALQDKNLQDQYERTLPGWTAEDIAGSPYAVYSYMLDSRLGQPQELPLLKEKLNSMGLGLILDFVPNHLALDHAWTLSHPHRFVQATEEERAQHPGDFFQTPGGAWLAHGRDPNFPPWQDTVQVNFFSPELRQALIAELLKIAQSCDGVRCDMAMLGLNSVFYKVWGKCIDPLTEVNSEFWEEAIGRVKSKYPGFIFIAEAYWGTEAELRQMGFDYTYDKGLYDRLRYEPAPKIREYIREAGPGLKHSLLFVENHDESRAVRTFGQEKSLAAATAICTLPCMRLLHGGQMEGLSKRLPVQMSRPAEDTHNSGVKAYYAKLLPACSSAALHDGSWQLLQAGPAWEGDLTFHSLLVWCWQYQDSFKLAAINYCDTTAYGRVRLPLVLENAQRLVSDDRLHGRVYSSPAAEVREQGLYIELPPWGSHILDVRVDQGK